MSLEPSDSTPAMPSPPPAKAAWLRFLPLAVLAAAMAVVFATGAHTYLSFESIGTNYDALRAFVAANRPLAVASFMLVYVALVALSAPGALILTIAGGLLLGWKLALPATVVAATLGATIVFVIARSSFGEALARKAGPSLAKLRAGFQENALSYLLFLRLVPLFPFFLVNIAPALLGVPLRTFVVATLFGIIPGTAAFSVAGAGLGSVIEAQNVRYAQCLSDNPGNGSAACSYKIETSALVTTELLAAFALLGIVALIPVALKYFRGRNAQG